jgi:hypothetical protein
MVMFAPHVSIDCNGIIGKVDKLTIEHNTTKGLTYSAYNDVNGGQSQDGYSHDQ